MAHHFLQRTLWHLGDKSFGRPVSLAVATTLLLSSGITIGSSFDQKAIASTHASNLTFGESNWSTSLFEVVPSSRLSQNSEDIDDVEANSSESDNETASNDRRFTCQYSDGDFVVMYTPEEDPGEYYPWAIPGEMGGGWTPERRCNTISDRLESYRPDGLLELKTDVENGYDTVCATTSSNAACRIVFTVPEGQDPLETRDLVFENLAVANSGQDTYGVTTFQGVSSTGNVLEQLGAEFGLNLPSLPTSSSSTSFGRSSSINLRPFLSPADGGTGTAL